MAQAAKPVMEISLGEHRGPGPDADTSAVLASNPEQPKQDDDHQGNPQ